jgi:hypothetical protein
MTKVELLQEEIEKLDHDEWAKLYAWMLERDSEQWDREIEEDSVNGRLDEFFEAALREHREGKSKKL